MEQAQEIMEPALRKLEYRIVTHSAPVIGAALLAMEEEMNKLLNEGWQKASDIRTFQMETLGLNGLITVYQELIREIPEEEPKYDETAFVTAYAALDPHVRDLLEINQVGFGFEKGRPYTYFGEEKIEGFMSPTTVLARLKNSGHLPIDLDEYGFVTELGKLLCAY